MEEQQEEQEPQESTEQVEADRHQHKEASLRLVQQQEVAQPVEAVEDLQLERALLEYLLEVEAAEADRMEPQEQLVALEEMDVQEEVQQVEA